jgi:DNA polymerase I-like protein with 3'-5' exonuclease and polymerase domains
MFKAREGYVFVGSDLAALENRIIGHYTSFIDGGEYADLILNGDVHTETCRSLGVANILRCDEKEARNATKSISYAMMYGAREAKIASMLGCNNQTAKNLWFKYWNDKAALNILKSKLTEAANSRGERKYVKSIDERPIYTRSQHSILNAKIQGDGAILFKNILVQTGRMLVKEGINAHIVGNWHDEVLIEVECGQEDKVVDIINKACYNINNKFKLKIPLVMESRVGNTWPEVH